MPCSATPPPRSPTRRSTEPDSRSRVPPAQARLSPRFQAGLKQQAGLRWHRLTRAIPRIRPRALLEIPPLPLAKILPADMMFRVPTVISSLRTAPNIRSASRLLLTVSIGTRRSVWMYQETASLVNLALRWAEVPPALTTAPRGRCVGMSIRTTVRAIVSPYAGAHGNLLRVQKKAYVPFLEIRCLLSVCRLATRFCRTVQETSCVCPRTMTLVVSRIRPTKLDRRTILARMMPSVIKAFSV